MKITINLGPFLNLANIIAVFKHSTKMASYKFSLFIFNSDLTVMWHDRHTNEFWTPVSVDKV